MDIRKTQYSVSPTITETNKMLSYYFIIIIVSVVAVDVVSEADRTRQLETTVIDSPVCGSCLKAKGLPYLLLQSVLHSIFG